MTSIAESGSTRPWSVRTAAVVLAAGEGRRFGGGGHKLLASFRDRPVVAHAVADAVEAGLDEVIVVTGAVDLAEVLPAAVTVVHNPSWVSGQSSSLQVGISEASARGCDAVVVGLGDQPMIGPGPWRAVAASEAPIAAASYRGKRRNPVRLARSVWPLLPESGDEGARALMRVRHDLVREVPCEGEPADIDTLEDLDRWN